MKALTLLPLLMFTQVTFAQSIDKADTCNPQKIYGLRLAGTNVLEQKDEAGVTFEESWTHAIEDARTHSQQFDESHRKAREIAQVMRRTAAEIEATAKDDKRLVALKSKFRSLNDQATNLVGMPPAGQFSSDLTDYSVAADYERDLDAASNVDARTLSACEMAKKIAVAPIEALRAGELKPTSSQQE